GEAALELRAGPGRTAAQDHGGSVGGAARRAGRGPVRGRVPRRGGLSGPDRELPRAHVPAGARADRRDPARPDPPRSPRPRRRARHDREPARRRALRLLPLPRRGVAARDHERRRRRPLALRRARRGHHRVLSRRRDRPRARRARTGAGRGLPRAQRRRRRPARARVAHPRRRSHRDPRRRRRRARRPPRRRARLPRSIDARGAARARGRLRDHPRARPVRIALLLVLLAATAGAEEHHHQPRFEPTHLQLEDPGVLDLDFQLGPVKGQDPWRIVVPDFEIDLGILPYLELDIDGAWAFEGTSGGSTFFDHTAPDNLWVSVKLGLLDTHEEDRHDAWALGVQLGPKLPGAPDTSGVGVEGLLLVGRYVDRTHVVLNLGGFWDPAVAG